MKLKKIDSQINSSTMTMLLVGKGPSAKPIKRLNKNTIQFGSDQYSIPARTEIMTINDAWKIVDSTDYAIMGDWCVLKDLYENKKNFLVQRNGIKRLIIPTFAHVYEHVDNVKGIISGLYPCHEDYSFKSEEYQKYIEDTPYYLYQLEGSILNYFGVSYQSEINTVAGSVLNAVDFGISRGFRHFIMTGFDPDMIIDDEVEIFSDTFKQQEITDKKARLSYYQFSHAKTIEKIVSSGCTYEMLNIDSISKVINN